MRHKWEVMTKKSSVVICLSLSGPMRGVRCNKETFSVELLEGTHAGKSVGALYFTA